jgi:hypothetical protein
MDGELMVKSRAVKTYKVWFKPESDAKEPPTYQLYFSAVETPRLFNATVVAVNSDSPRVSDGTDGHWNRCGQDSIEALVEHVEKELKELNKLQEFFRAGMRIATGRDGKNG